MGYQKVRLGIVAEVVEIARVVRGLFGGKVG
jgi:hypothetical protein